MSRGVSSWERSSLLVPSWLMLRLFVKTVLVLGIGLTMMTWVVSTHTIPPAHSSPTSPLTMPSIDNGTGSSVMNRGCPFPETKQHSPLLSVGMLPTNTLFASASNIGKTAHRREPPPWFLDLSTQSTGKGSARYSSPRKTDTLTVSLRGWMSTL